MSADSAVQTTDRPEWQVLFDAAMQQKQASDNAPIDHSTARRLLIACYSDQLVAGEVRDYSQFFFCESIWQQACAAALKTEDNDSAGEQLSQKILEIERELITAGVPENVARIGRYFVANFYYQRNQFQELESALQDPEFVAAITSDDVFSVFKGSYLNLCGLLATQQMNFADAFEYHERALATRKALPWAIDVAESLNNLGLLAWQMGDFVASKEYLLEAIPLYPKGKSPQQHQPTMAEMIARLNYANAIQYSETPPAYRKAELLQTELIEAVDRSIETAPASERLPWQSFRCVCRNNLAIVLYNTGQFAKCNELLSSVRAERLSISSPEDIHLAEDEINAGWGMLATNQHDQAETFFRSALDRINTHHPESHRLPECRSYLARVLLPTDSAEGRRLLNEAIDQRETDLFAALSTSLSNRNRLAILQNLRMHPESIAWPGEFDTYLELANAFEISLKEKYRRVLNWKGVLARFQQKSKSSDYVAIHQLEAERSNLRRKLFLATQCESAEPATDLDPTKLERQSNKLERRLRRLQSARKELPPPILPANVQQSIPAGNALLDIIEYRQYLNRNEGDTVYDQRRYGAFLVTQDDLQWIDLGAQEKVDDLLFEFRDRMKQKQDATATLVELNRLFGGPLKLLLGKTKLLWIAADGQFQNLAWAAISDSQNPANFWGDSFEIVTVPSAGSLVRNQDETIATGERDKALTWAAVGGVDYGSRGTRDRWSALEGTGHEATFVNELFSAKFPDAKKQIPLAGKTATKQAVLDNLLQKNIIHIATHGNFAAEGDFVDAFAVQDANRSMDSALVLAGANNDPTCGFDTMLTADELTGLQLGHVRLLMLSACETGLGHIQAGQGMVGLTAALERSGVASTVASLWKVDDRATQILMEYFYLHLLQDPQQFSVSAALQHAQQKLRQHDVGKYKAPYYWAPWVIVGSPMQSRPTGGVETEQGTPELP